MSAVDHDDDAPQDGVASIAVAVVRQQRCVLVGTRGPDGVLPGMSEFPGGKVQFPERAASAAVRECLEETGIHAAIESLIANVTHEYAHGRLQLAFYDCRPVESEGTLPAPHSPFRWLPIAELAALRFPAANRRVLQWLQEND